MSKRVLFTILPSLFINTLFAQQVKRVTGVVLSSDNNQPVAGATIRIEGTNKGTSTDTDGKFILNNLDPGERKLIISYIGMETRVENVRPEMRILLTHKTNVMNEVMVVAYGTSKRSAFTGSVTVINADEIARTQTTNVMQALAGKVPGLQMTSGMGEPGMENNSYLIRGIGSINASTGPLIVLDGMPYSGSWNDINPSDVASISVLKDAAANALYGARGANGVIIITTKQAKSGNAVVSASANWGVNTRGTIDYDYIKNPGLYYEIQYKALYNELRYEKKLSAEDAFVQANKNLIDSNPAVGGLGYNIYSYPENEYLIDKNGQLNPHATLGRVVGKYMLYPDDWTKEIYGDGLRQEYNVNVSGGSNTIRLYSSFGYLKDEGIVPNSNYERYTIRIKGEHQVRPWLRYGINASYANGKHEASAYSDSNMEPSLSSIAPIYPLYVRDEKGNILTDENGKIYDYGAGTSGPSVTRPVSNNSSIQEAILNLNETTSNSLNGNAFVDVTFLKDFKFTFNVGTSVSENRNYQATNPFYGYNATLNGQITVGHYRTTTVNLQQILNYNHKFGGHHLSVMIGHESYKYNSTNLSGSKKNMFSYWDNHELDGAVIDNSDSHSSQSNYNTEGYFFRTLYDYEGRYFLSTSYRRDASSHFDPNHWWGNFYSVGAAWLISEEKWFKADWVDMLKLKLSFGQQGNDGIGDYNYTDRYSIGNSNDQLSISFAGRGNKDITWETNTNLNWGLEFSLLNGKWIGDLEYFHRKTSNMLNWFTVPPSLGYSGYYDNIGNMINKGIEFSVSYIPVHTKDLTWKIDLNLTHYKNRITYLPKEKKATDMEGYMGYINGDRFYGEGLPINTWRLKRYAGVSEEGLSQWYYKDKETGEEKKTTTYTSGDYYLCGDPNPKLYGGFGTSLDAFGFDFSVQFTYSLGGKAYDAGYAAMMGNPIAGATGYRLHKDILKAWSNENKDSNIPRWYFNDLNTNASSDRFLLSASYLNLQNIQMGYSLPKKLISRIGISKLRLYIMCDNVYYWSARKGFDPRYSLSGNSAQGIISPLRCLSGGVSVQF